MNLTRTQNRNRKKGAKRTKKRGPPTRRERRARGGTTQSRTRQGRRARQGPNRGRGEVRTQVRLTPNLGPCRGTLRTPALDEPGKNTRVRLPASLHIHMAYSTERVNNQNSKLWFTGNASGWAELATGMTVMLSAPPRPN